ncbi:hypothetical protein [Janthinobacterium sp.]|uniref:hypothetical protein n=1 Tax=Janthinobacterium sp. TaxID=1871054 RepID=UPI00293D9365|nr:hypothetical protein [Janthinobacterium sp.]
MTICVVMVGAEEASKVQKDAAVQRFVAALQEALGGPELVAPVYRAYMQLRAVYGETPDLEKLTDAQRMIFEQWQVAETAAVVAALGPHRYLEEPQFEISL